VVEPPKNILLGVTYLTSLLMWHWLSGFHVSPRFVNYVYLKYQLDLDTCHHLIGPRVLADVDCDDVGSQCVCHVS
jgi:hypothetical protein